MEKTESGMQEARTCCGSVNRGRKLVDLSASQVSTSHSYSPPETW